MKVTLTDLEKLRDKDEGKILDFFYNLFITFGKLYQPKSTERENRIFVRVFYEDKNYDYFYVWSNVGYVDVEAPTGETIHDICNDRESFNKWFGKNFTETYESLYNLPKIEIFD